MCVDDINKKIAELNAATPQHAYAVSQPALRHCTGAVQLISMRVRKPLPSCCMDRPPPPPKRTPGSCSS